MSVMEKRPWGRMWKLLSTPWLWVKIIRVDDGQSTSVQYHWHRAEWHLRLGRRPYGHWRTRYVGRRETHSMGWGTYLEIAWGRLDENDIVRLQDMYGRGPRRMSRGV